MSEPLALPGLPWPVELRPHPRARHLRLRVDEARSLLRLTVPRRVSRRAALDWARGQADWVEAQLHQIKEMGYERYLSNQTQGSKD